MRTMSVIGRKRGARTKTHVALKLRVVMDGGAAIGVDYDVLGMNSSS